MSLQWNPGVADRSGEIFSNAAGNAAQLRLGGTQAMAQGVQQAGQSIGNALSDSMGQILTKKIEDGRLAEMNLGRRDALAAIGPEYGLDPQMLDTLLSMEAKQPEKMSAMLDVFEQHVGQQMKTGYMDRQHQNAVSLARLKANLDYENMINRPVPPPKPSETFIPTFEIMPGIDMSR